MSPEERAVRLCLVYDDHAHGNMDALGKCCEKCQPIAEAIAASLAQRDQQWAQAWRNEVELESWARTYREVPNRPEDVQACWRGAMGAEREACARLADRECVRHGETGHFMEAHEHAQVAAAILARSMTPA